MATWWNDYMNNAVQGQSFFALANDTLLEGAAVDMKEAEVGLHADLQTGVIASGSHAIKLQESEDGLTNWADIEDAVFATLVSGGPDDNDSRSLNFKRSKRYVRAVADSTGSGDYAVSIHGLRKAGPYPS